MKEMISKVNSHSRVNNTIKIILIISLLCFSSINSQPTSCTDVKQCLDTTSSATGVCQTIGRTGDTLILKDTKTGLCFFTNCGTNRCWDSKTFYCYELEGKVRQIDGSCGDICNNGSCNGGDNICLATKSKRLREFKTASCVESCPTTTSPAQCLVDTTGFNCKEVSAESKSRRSFDDNGTCVDVCLEGNCYDENFVCSPVGVNRWRQINTSACNTSCLGASCKPNSTSFVCLSTSGTNYKKADGFCASSCPLTECISDVANRICSLNSNNPLTVRRFEDGVCASQCSDRTCFRRDNSFNCQEVSSTFRRELSSICNSSCTEDKSCLDSVNNICLSTNSTRRRNNLNLGICIITNFELIACPAGSCLESTDNYYCSANTSSNVREITGLCAPQCSGNSCWNSSFICIAVDNNNRKQLLTSQCNLVCTGNSCDDGSNVCQGLSIIGTIKVRLNSGLCASSCTENGYCYDNNGLCIATQEGRIKDTNTKCGEICTGNSCWKSDNYSCRSTDSGNFKALSNNQCISTCVDKTCSNSNFVCQNVNPLYRLPSGFCSNGCEGNFCISDPDNFDCQATSSGNYKDTNGLCNTFCTGNSCYESPNFICNATTSQKFKNFNSMCGSDCSAGFCKSNGNDYTCLANAELNVRLANGFCAAKCPNNFCNGSDYICIATASNNIRDNSGKCALGGICSGGYCWTDAGYNCEPTNKNKFKELNGRCNSSCSGNSCLLDTYDFICVATSNEKRKTLDGSCKLQCDHGSCYDSNNVCLPNGLYPLRIRDVNGNCATECSGNTCYSSNNDFTCTPTDMYNYKQLDSTCNAYCIGKSCASSSSSFTCVQTSSSLFKNTDYNCVSECPQKTCLDNFDSRFYCLNTNPRRVRQFSNNYCSSACSTDYCFNENYHCISTVFAKKSMNGSCTQICQSPHCNEAGSCIQGANFSKYRDSNGECTNTCDFTKECVSSAWICSKRTYEVLGQADNSCGTSCPMGTCYETTGNDAFKCIAYPGKIANENGKCVSECPNASQCLNIVTEFCQNLTINRLRSVYGHCVEQCNWTTQCYDATSFKCLDLSSNNKVQENDYKCADSCDNTGIVSRCRSSSSRICLNTNSSLNIIRTSDANDTCITSCPSNECYNNKNVCVNYGSSKIDFTSTMCIDNCDTLDGKCIDGNFCKNTSSSLFKKPDGTCTNQAQCGSGFCIDPKNTSRCLAVSATNVKRFTDKKCNFACEVGYCYNTNFECEKTLNGNVRDSNGACAASCSVRYFIDNNFHCIYTDYDHVILFDGTVGTKCPDNFCMENNTTRKCVATNGTNNINDNGICNNNCSVNDECFDSVNFNCKKITLNNFKAVNGSCQNACGTNECVSSKITVTGGNAFICSANSYLSLESPNADRMCLSQCPIGYCFNDNYKCILADGSNYRNVDVAEVGKCNATCLNNSCKSMNEEEFLCYSTVNLQFKKSAVNANCVVECETGYCHNASGVCESTTNSKFRDVNGQCSSTCSGATCANSANNYTCTAATNSLRKGSNSMCTGSCAANECFDQNFVCRTTSTDAFTSIVNDSGACKCNLAKRCLNEEGTCVRPTGNSFSLTTSNTCTTQCSDPSVCKHPFRNYCAAVGLFTKNPSTYCNGLTRITYIGYFSDFTLQQQTNNVVNSYHQLNYLSTYSDGNENYPYDYYFSILYKDGNSSVRYSDTSYAKYYDIYSKHLTLNNSYNYVVFYDFSAHQISGDNDYYSVTVNAIIASCEDDAVKIYNSLPNTVEYKLIAYPTYTTFELDKEGTRYSQSSVNVGLSKGLNINRNVYSFEDILLADFIEKTNQA